MPEIENQEPSKYLMTFTDRDGNQETHYVAMTPDPQNADKVKAQLLKTRTDLLLRGVTASNMTVTKVGPQSAMDAARVGSVMSGAVRPVKP